MISKFNTDLDKGLTNRDIPHRRAINGFNEFEVAEGESLTLRFAKQFYENPLIILLFIAAAVSWLMGQTNDAFSITLVGNSSKLCQF